MAKKLLYIFAVLAVLLMPAAVYAATQTLSLTGEGDQVDGTYTGGAADYTNLNVDSTSSYLTLDEEEEHCFNVTNTAITPDVINYVRITFKWDGSYFAGTPPAGSTYTRLRPYVRISGTNYYGTAKTATGSWQTDTNYWYNDPSTGSAWTEAAIDSAQFGFKCIFYVDPGMGDPDEARICYTYVTVQYDPLTAPDVETDAVTNITGTTAQLNGEITATGGENADMRGFVWDTSTHANPGNVAPPATYSDNATENGSFAEAIFDYTGGTFVAGTTYYVRAYAHNSQGWTYGDEVTFTTIDVPTITTDAATNVGATTARINSTVTDDGGEACDVRFGYDTVTRANIELYANLTPWVNDTYTTGNKPYVDLTSLTPGQTYYFRVQIKNVSGNTTGSEVTFLTGTGVIAPTLFHAKPEANSNSLTWLIGDGATTTMIRYKEGSFPTTTSDGTLVYNGVMNNTMHDDLIEGTTYYYSAWGVSGNLTSPSYATVMSTTLADGADLVDLELPGSYPGWMQSTNYQNLSGNPLYGWVNWIADTWSMPRASFWLAIWFILPVMIGMWLFYKNANILVVGIILVAFIAIGVKAEILAGWITFLYASMMAFGLWVGHRLT